MRFKKTLTGLGLAAAAATLAIGVAGPASATQGPWTSFQHASSVAPGATGMMAFAVQNSGDEDLNFGSNTPGGMANPSTMVFHAPDHTTFPDQAAVWNYYSTVTSIKPPTGDSGGMHATSCVVSDAGKTLSCALTGGANAATIPGALRSWWPLVTVDSSVIPGTVLTGGSADLNAWNYTGTNVGYRAGSSTETLLTGPIGPGAPIYNTDATVDVPGYGNPGATITIKDANGNTIGTTTVNPDGSYDVKIAAADAATAAAAGPVKVTESDLPGTTWPVTIDIPQLGTPIINPLVGGGIALAAAAGLGTVLLVRRRKTAEISA